VAFNGDICLDLARQFLALAEKQADAAPLAVGHRIMGHSLLYAGDMMQAREHYDKGLALYDPLKHRPLARLLAADIRVTILSLRSGCLWFLGWPERALADADRVVTEAREINEAASMMNALFFASWTHRFCGNYAKATALNDEVASLADEKTALFWKAGAVLAHGVLLVETGDSLEARDVLSSGLALHRSMGSTVMSPSNLASLAMACAKCDQFDEAWRHINESLRAIETTKESWHADEVNRLAGEIALMAPQRDVSQAEVHFSRALSITRTQQTKSWELRAARSMARLWRDQGKRAEAHEILAPVYNWFTEGFDTLDLKEAKALLDALA
jgi:predicted ATPase